VPEPEELVDASDVPVDDAELEELLDVVVPEFDSEESFRQPELSEPFPQL
jgi:hypothetical protein